MEQLVKLNSIFESVADLLKETIDFQEEGAFVDFEGDEGVACVVLVEPDFAFLEAVYSYHSGGYQKRSKPVVQSLESDERLLEQVENFEKRQLFAAFQLQTILLLFYPQNCSISFLLNHLEGQNFHDWELSLKAPFVNAQLMLYFLIVDRDVLNLLKSFVVSLSMLGSVVTFGGEMGSVGLLVRS